MDLKQKVKLLLLFVFVALLLFSFTGCESTTINVNVENSEELNNTVLGRDVFVSIGNDLFYDSTTRIVYMQSWQYQSDDIYVPYYAPNGLPYRYNPETNTFEEIEGEK